MECFQYSVNKIYEREFCAIADTVLRVPGYQWSFVRSVNEMAAQWN